MNYFNILNCSGNITSCCTSPAAAAFMGISRKIYAIIQILVPIVLIVSLIVKFVKLSVNPETKNGIKPIINAIIATIVIFFLPSLMSVVLGLLPEQIQLTACWQSAVTEDYITRTSAYNYVDKNVKRKFLPGNGDYQKGDPSKNTSSNSRNGSGDKTVGGAVYLDGGMPIPLYYQQDYADVILRGDRTVSTSGCGFTSCAMVVSYLLDQKITPREFVGEWSRKHYDHGMLWTLPAATCQHYNIPTVEQTTSISKVVQALKTNHPVMSSQGPGLFTSGGHLIVLRGITDDGLILVNDPNKPSSVGKDYNHRKFTQDEINRANRMYFIYPTKEQCK